MHPPPIDPPTTLAGRLREIGPGIIISGAIVGSGELIVTTKLGAEAGFALLWLILFSCWFCDSLPAWGLGEPGRMGWLW